MIDISQKIKSLKTRVFKSISKRDAFKTEQKELNKTINDLNSLIKSLNNQIKELENTKTLRVTEHAMLRYFERVKGFNLKEIENEILEDKILKMIKVLGGKGTFPNSKGYSLIIDNYSVTTIITSKSKKK